MIGELKPYPEYKRSDLTWLDQLPAHWHTQRSKYLFRETDQRSVEGNEQKLSMSQRLGLVPSSQVDSKRLVSESNIGGKLCAPGDLVLNRLKAHLGVIATAPVHGVVSPDYTVLRPLGTTNHRYFCAVYRSPVCGQELRLRAKGIVEGFWRLYTDDFYDIRVPLPPPEEQAAIVRFLDWANGRLERAVQAKRKVIDLLNEQKEAIIHRAVVIGARSSVAVARAALPTLKDVPSHWGVGALRRFWQVTDCKHLTVPFVEHGVPLASVSEVQKFILNLDQCKRTTREWYELLIEGNRRPTRGDLIYCRNVGVGASALVETDLDFAMGQDVCLIRSSSNNQRFLNYQLHSPLMRRQLDLLLVGSTFKRINISQIKSLWVVAPPRHEQDLICAFLDAELLEYDRSIESIEREITHIREYQTRLTADIVTGQLDVRQAASRLPDDVSSDTHNDDPDLTSDGDDIAEADEEESTA